MWEIMCNFVGDFIMRKYAHYILTILVLCITGCKTTKFVPEGELLLNKVHVKVASDKPARQAENLSGSQVSSETQASDGVGRAGATSPRHSLHISDTGKPDGFFSGTCGSNVPPAQPKTKQKHNGLSKSEANEIANDLKNYLRQKQNTEILGFWKLQLDVYNTAPKDTTSKANKFFARNAHKIGEAPVIYDPELTGVSMQQLNQAMQNKGFFRVEVDTLTKVKDRKMYLTYLVTANTPYTIRRYNVDITQPEVREIATSKKRTISTGMQFDATMMDEERQRITTEMHNNGYFYFDKSMLVYTADSSYRDNSVEVEMSLSQYVQDLPDSVRTRLYTKYTIRKVFFHTDGDMFIRERVLRNNCRIKEGKLYAEWRVERTYALLNGLGAVKYVDIAFDPIGTDQLDCHITVSKSKVHTVSAELEGTYSAGDWGIGAGLGYQNKNIFKGSELLSLNARASYEWRQNGGRAIEAKAEAGLAFPTQVKINVAYNYQQRPSEYTRTIANAGLYYTVPHKRHSQWTHRFNLIDISYIYLPWMSDQFKEDFIDRASVLKASYEDHFILDWSYSGQFTNQNKNKDRSYVKFNYSVETAGNVLYGLARAAKFNQDESGAYTLWHIPFAQYAKGDVNFVFHHVMAPSHRLVYHVGVGVAVPYLNAQTIPFEKRYFSGGANSVRGWQARTLGPGGFRGKGNSLVYDLQAGDIRLDLNIEYRWKVWNFIELAAFVDAGNIWTIYDYEQQPNGVFLWDEFYKQIAMSWGLGLRLDFSILVLRLDFGVKLHDPTRMYGELAGTEWRTASNHLNWNDDCTVHFAIGYPF